MKGEYTARDFPHSPLMFYYEVTLACDLVCKHCRASAQAEPHPAELSPSQSRALLDQIASFPRPPHVVFTGGDPLKRPDLLELVCYAVGLGLEVALTPSATPLATPGALAEAKHAGVKTLGLSLDGSDASTHDAFRGWEGSFQRTSQMLDFARRFALPVQVNTTVVRRNVHQIDTIAELLAERGIAVWAVFFLVPVGRGIEEERLAPAEYEAVFARLWHHAQSKPYVVKTTEAPHYRRYVLQQGGNPLAPPRGKQFSTVRHRGPLGVGDGKGIMFVSHIGEIFPAGFLPLCCGRFPADNVVQVYQQHPVFLALRNPEQLKGRCGRCEYRRICGGSRARAYALTGDYLEADPDCTYEPQAAPCISDDM